MEDFTKAFSVVNKVLINTKSLWQIVAFEHSKIPWADEYPNLNKFITNLSNEEIDQLDADHDALVKCLMAVINQDINFSGIEENILNPRRYIKSIETVNKIPNELKHFSAGIKGRKWQQIQQFSQVLLHNENNIPYLEWCSGKGHLGRLVSKLSDKGVTSIEWQKSLCDHGEKLSSKHNIKQTFINGDAFKDGRQLLKPEQHAFALHACGDLHVELINQGVIKNTVNLTIAPCCYHLIRSKQFKPMSHAAMESNLKLSTFDLRLPLQHSIIANEKQNTLRNKEVHWRLSFDELQKEMLFSNKYLPLPTLKQSQLSEGFEQFCRWAIKTKNIDIVGEINYQKFLNQGKERQKVAKQIDLVRHLFRYTLEMWLAYDKAVFLKDNNYQVEIMTFCEMSITPRNLLINAKKD